MNYWGVPTEYHWADPPLLNSQAQGYVLGTQKFLLK